MKNDCFKDFIRFGNTFDHVLFKAMYAVTSNRLKQRVKSVLVSIPCSFFSILFRGKLTRRSVILRVEQKRSPQILSDFAMKDSKWFR